MDIKMTLDSAISVTSPTLHLIYKDECMYVCMYVCIKLIQIHISEPI